MVDEAKTEIEVIIEDFRCLMEYQHRLVTSLFEISKVVEKLLLEHGKDIDFDSFEKSCSELKPKVLDMKGFIESKALSVLCGVLYGKTAQTFGNKRTFFTPGKKFGFEVEQKVHEKKYEFGDKSIEVSIAVPVLRFFPINQGVTGPRKFLLTKERLDVFNDNVSKVSEIIDTFEEIFADANAFEALMLSMNAYEFGDLSDCLMPESSPVYQIAVFVKEALEENQDNIIDFMIEV